MFELFQLVMLRNVIAQIASARCYCTLLLACIDEIGDFYRQFIQIIKKVSKNASFSKNFKILEKKFKHNKRKAKQR